MKSTSGISIMVMVEMVEGDLSVGGGDVNLPFGRLTGESFFEVVFLEESFLGDFFVELFFVGLFFLSSLVSVCGPLFLGESFSFFIIY